MKGRTINLAAVALFAGILANVLPATPDKWSTKDWHQWTERDCDTILTSSPWAKTLSIGNDLSSYTRHERVSYTVQLISALPIRQALARQRQIEIHYDQMDLEKRQATNQTATPEIVETYDDRIVVRVTIDLVDIRRPTAEEVSKYSPRWPWIVFPTGRSLHPRDIPGNHLNSRGQWVLDSTFQRLRGGQPLIDPKDKKIRIEFLSPTGTAPFLVFEFDLRKMVYAGKLEY